MKITHREPNHICQNPLCNKGEDGQAKHYYACDYCDRTNKHSAYTCSIECWNEMCDVYNGKVQLPVRTDKTEDEVKALYEKPIEQVKQETLNDLADMAEIVADGGIQAAIDVINEDIQTRTKTKKQRKDKW